MRLSQVRSVSEPLRLGRLQGNHFDLVVRDLRPHGATDPHCSGADKHTRLAELVKEAVENVKVFIDGCHHHISFRNMSCLTFPPSPWSLLQGRGFVNYYGPQRFGSGQSVQSDRVGLALLKEDMVSVTYTGLDPTLFQLQNQCCCCCIQYVLVCVRSVLCASSSPRRTATILRATQRDTSSRQVRAGTTTTKHVVVYYIFFHDDQRSKSCTSQFSVSKTLLSFLPLHTRQC